METATNLRVGHSWLYEPNSIEVLRVTHVRPDGTAIGIALYGPDGKRTQGPDYYVVFTDEFLQRYAEMPLVLVWEDWDDTGWIDLS